MKKINQKILAGATSLATVMTLGIALFTPLLTQADIDPIGCSATGGSIILTTYRADGTTPIGGGTVTDGELIKYKATLGSLPSPVCAYQAGTWSITTPDAVVHDVTPGGGIPRIGGTGITSLDSALVSYTVLHANEVVTTNRHINASTSYGGGFSHKSADDSLAGPTLGTSEQTVVIHTPTVTTNVHDAAHATITSAAIGSTVHDNATVAGVVGGPVPTGTVDFTLYAGTSCAGQGTTQSAVALVAGSAESNTTTVSVGGLSYKAHYNGDGNYVAADGACEPLTANKLTPTVTTDIHNAAHAIITTANTSDIIHDSATVSGGLGTPTGTVDFTFYSNGTCASVGTASGTGIALNGSGIADPSSTQGPLAVGSYSFKAHYNGDGTYATADGACEPLTVSINHPTIATNLSATTVNTGTAVHDSSTLSGATGTAGGSVTYAVYTDNACTLGAQSAGTKTVTNGLVPDSDPITFNAAGTFYWQASYSGDANNAAAVSQCQSEVLTVSQPAGQYCSPGYWKQPQHFHSYVTYHPTDLFSTVFGVNPFNVGKGKKAATNPTLVEALSGNGGGVTMEARVAVDALLNSTSMNYAFTTAQVIQIVHDAFVSGDFSAFNAFTTPENCPLN